MHYSCCGAETEREGGAVRLPWATATMSERDSTLPQHVAPLPPGLLRRPHRCTRGQTGAARRCAGHWNGCGVRCGACLYPGSAGRCNDHGHLLGLLRTLWRVHLRRYFVLRTPPVRTSAPVVLLLQQDGAQGRGLRCRGIRQDELRVVSNLSVKPISRYNFIT